MGAPDVTGPGGVADLDSLPLSLESPSKFRSGSERVIDYCVHIVVGNRGVIELLHKVIPDARVWPWIRAAIAGAIAGWLLGYYFMRRWAGSSSLTGDTRDA